MTADRPPGEPATEAGRDFLYDYQAFGPPSVRQFTDGILAIEAEARATAPLDVERLKAALHAVRLHEGPTREIGMTEFAKIIAAEYRAVLAVTATPQPASPGEGER